MLSDKEVFYMALLLTFVSILLMFKLTGFLLRVCGRVLGVFLSLAGYLLLGLVLMPLFGAALFVIPGLLLIGAVTVLGWLIPA